VRFLEPRRRARRTEPSRDRGHAARQGGRRRERRRPVVL